MFAARRQPLGGSTSARPLTRRVGAAVFAAALVAAALTACVPGDPMPTPTDGTKSATPTPTPTKPPPVLDPEASAEENFEFWEYLVELMYDSYQMVDGSVMIQSLVDNGFNKADMELTPNETAIGERADSVVFSVRFQGECLIGQIAPTWWSADRAPILGTGKCLIGTTRPIDF